MVQAVLLGAGVGAKVRPVKVESLEDIQGLVGGHIDAVRMEVADNLMAVGYVHDEGLLLDMETNWLASALFQQEIRGDVVVVNGYSPNGVYDGENYDVPTNFIKYLAGTFTQRVAETYNESMAITLAMGIAMDSGALSEDERNEFIEQLGDYVTNGGIDEAQGKRLSEMIDSIINKAEDALLDDVGDTLVNEIEDFLKGEQQ